MTADNTIPTIEPSFGVIARECHSDLGGRSDLLGVLTCMKKKHADVVERQADSGLLSKIRTALLEHDSSGLPFASSVKTEDGTEYVQRPLFVVSDYEETINRHISLADANLGVAHRLSDECFGKFRVRFDVPTLDLGDDEQATA